jgi:AcrR family transcriptional regulator
MEQIGERADVSRATVFNYFARKEAIVFEWFDDYEPSSQALAEDDRHTVDSTSRLRHVLRAFADLYEDDPATDVPWCAPGSAGGPLLADESDAPPARGRQRARWTTSRRHPRGVDPDRAALILFDAYLGVLYRWVLDETDQLALGEQLTATLDLILPPSSAQSRRHQRAPPPPHQQEPPPVLAMSPLGTLATDQSERARTLHHSDASLLLQLGSP